MIVSFVGLQARRSFPGQGRCRWSSSGSSSWSAAPTTFAVLHGQDEEEAQAEELEQAGEEVEAAEEDARPPKARRRRRSRSGGEAEARPREAKKAAAPKAEGGPRRDDAAARRRSPTEIAFDTTELSSKPGKVTIDFNNPAPLEHDVAIEQDGKEIADSETIAEGEDLGQRRSRAGTYTFLCTVPGPCRSRHGRHPHGQVAPARDGATPAYPDGDGQAFHVTTFGCQMNVHDSERMRGMLDVARLRGGGEPRGGRPDPLQHLLDPRVGRQPLHRPPRRGEAAEVRRPRAGRRRRRLLGAVGQGRGLPSASPSSTSPSARARSTSSPSSSTPTRSAPRATSSSRTSPATCRPGASASSRAGCRSPRAATAAAPTASSPRPGGARSAATPASWSPRPRRWPPTGCAR